MPMHRSIYAVLLMVGCQFVESSWLALSAKAYPALCEYGAHKKERKEREKICNKMMQMLAEKVEFPNKY